MKAAILLVLIIFTCSFEFADTAVAGIMIY